MSVRSIQFAGKKGGRMQATPPRSGSWAFRRAPSWRRVGPKAVVAPVKKTARAVALDLIAIVVGLGMGVAVVAAIGTSGIL